MYTEQEMDQFGIINEETGEVEVCRQSLKRNFIERGVRILHKQETLKQDLAALLDEAKEKKFDKKQVKQLIANSFRNEIEQKIQELEDIQSELDNLFGAEDE